MSLGDILRRIRRAEAAAGRAADSVELVAVSKQQPDERVQVVLDAGHKRFGENRVQEAQRRWMERRRLDPGLILHLIGPLQTNKARAAVELFDVIETIDRSKVAHAVAEAIQAVGRAPRLYVQVNTGEEQQKSGIFPADFDDLLEKCRLDYGLQIDGLMAIPPMNEPAAPHFALLAAIGERHGISALSMGMSDDFEIAIGLGATSIRVGSGIFGARGAEAIER